MTLSLSAIESRALDVLNRSNALRVPVPLDQVAETLGVQIHHEGFEDRLSGMLVCKGDARHVVINAGHHPNRQRFTVAHELGHLVLHHKEQDSLFVDGSLQVYQRTGSSLSSAYTSMKSSTKPEEEREANRFASALLMPRTLVEEQIRSLNVDVLDEVGVAMLALSFGVSEQAMSIRLQHLGQLEVDRSA